MCSSDVGNHNRQPLAQGTVGRRYSQHMLRCAPALRRCRGLCSLLPVGSELRLGEPRLRGACHPIVDVIGRDAYLAQLEASAKRSSSSMPSRLAKFYHLQPAPKLGRPLPSAAARSETVIRQSPGRERSSCPCRPLWWSRCSAQMPRREHLPLPRARRPRRSRARALPAEQRRRCRHRPAAARHRPHRRGWQGRHRTRLTQGAKQPAAKRIARRGASLSGDDDVASLSPSPVGRLLGLLGMQRREGAPPQPRAPAPRAPPRATHG